MSTNRTEPKTEQHAGRSRSRQSKRPGAGNEEAEGATDNAYAKSQRGHSQKIKKPAGVVQVSSNQEADEVASFDEAQRRSKRRTSHNLKQNESSDLDEIPTNQNGKEEDDHGHKSGSQTADAPQANLYKKVTQRKQIIQKTIASNYNRKIGQERIIDSVNPGKANTG